MKKNYLNVILFLVLVLTLSGCSKNTIDDKTIVVGASVSPHAEILKQARPYIESKGYKLEIVEYTDYVQPNIGVSDGSLDANFFQHLPYLLQYNEENKTDIVEVFTVHFERLAIYKGKASSLEVKNAATIAVPNDATNEARALLLLDYLGLLTVDKNKGLKTTKADIITNPKAIKIVELEAAAIPSKLPELDLAIINGNVALTAKVTDKIIIEGAEDPNSDAALTYGNIIAVKKGNENKEAIQVLIEALKQENIATYINDKYHGVVVYLG